MRTLIAMAGLPGTGKSTVARGMAGACGAAVIDKDEVRAALFGRYVDYTDAQDDLCVGVMLEAAGYMLDHRPERPVILDGRTFTRLYQLAVVKTAAADLAARLLVVECVCPEATALARLAASDDHPAADRTPDLYRKLAETAEPLPPPKLVLDTGSATVERCVRLAVDHLEF